MRHHYIFMGRDIFYFSGSCKYYGNRIIGGFPCGGFRTDRGFRTFFHLCRSIKLAKSNAELRVISESVESFFDDNFFGVSLKSFIPCAEPLNTKLLLQKYDARKEIKNMDSMSLVTDALTNLVRMKNLSHPLWSFITGCVILTIDSLRAHEIYRIVRILSDFNCENRIVANKLDLIVEKLLGRLNVLVQDYLSRDLIDVKREPIKMLEVYKTESGKEIPINKWNSLDFNELWHLWYVLKSNKTFPSAHTVELLLEAMERQKQQIDSLDIRRTVRFMDLIVDKDGFFSITEEKLLEKLMRRFLYCFMNSSDIIDSKPENFLKMKKRGDIYLTLFQVKKSLHILEKLTRKMPRYLFKMLVKDIGIIGISNFMLAANKAISRSLTMHERLFASIGSTKGDTCLSMRTSKNIDINQSIFGKSHSLHTKILRYAIELMKFIDCMAVTLTKANADDIKINGIQGTPETGNRLRNVKLGVATLCSKLFSSAIAKNISLNVLRCKCAYYMILSLACDCKEREENCALVTPAENITNMMIDIHTGISIHAATEFDMLEYLSLLLHYERLVNLLEIIPVDIPKIDTLRRLANETALMLSRNPEVFLCARKVHHSKMVIYVTLMNKFNLMDLTIYDLFLRNIHRDASDWTAWSAHEIGMFCDLFFRTRNMLVDKNALEDSLGRQYDDGSPHESIMLLLGSLGDYMSQTELIARPNPASVSPRTLNIRKLNNNQFLSFIACLNAYNIAYKTPIVNEFRKRLRTMSCSQLAKAFGLMDDLSIRNSLLERISEVLSRKNYMVDIGPLLTLLRGSSIYHELLDILNQNASEITILEAWEHSRQKINRKMNRAIAETKESIKIKHGNLPETSYGIIVSVTCAKNFLDTNSCVQTVTDGNFYRKISKVLL